MNINLTHLLRYFDKTNGRASEELIAETQRNLDFVLPQDYLSVMREFNGGEGEIGDGSYLILLKMENLILMNSDYEFLMQEIPDYFLFGKDAADTAFAFHKKQHSYHSFGFLSDFRTDEIEFCGNNFEEFLEHLSNR